MSPALPSQTERPEDEPVEAIVFDVHPALLPASNPFAYPYGPPGESPFQVRPQDIYRPPRIFNFDLAGKPADYVVPQRFGIAAILGIMTALAILFGCLRWLEAEPGWYLFFGSQTVIICLAQMFHGKTPRMASAAAGAIMGPLFLLGTAWLSWEGVQPAYVLFLAFVMVPCGAFLGYLNGTCAAGIFLVMDKLEPYLQGQRPDAALANSSPALPAP